MKTFFWLNLELWCGKILDGNLNYTAISENDNIDPSLQRRAVAQQFLSISINTFSSFEIPILLPRKWHVLSLKNFWDSFFFSSVHFFVLQREPIYVRQGRRQWGNSKIVFVQGDDPWVHKDKYSTFLLQCFKVLSKAKCDIVPCTTREIKIELLLPIWKIYHRFLPSDSWSREGDGLEEHWAKTKKKTLKGKILIEL